jgi:hemoglobin/transferrin/lactoferrin receptor protein
MKYLFTLCLFIGMTLSAYSQTVTVIDQRTEEPLEGVVLMSNDSRTTLITNRLGQADISSFEGYAAILIRSLGYKTIVLSYDQIRASDFIITLERTTLNLEQVVVSATRWRQSSGSIPLSIASVSPEELTLQNPQTAADLLGVTNKVFIQKSQQGGGSPMIRGFATNRLIYSIDGVRMNTAIFRGGNIQNVISLDPFAIQNTEVLFGPGSVIYGSDAIGGVMSFQTLIPRLAISDDILVAGKSDVRYSSANNERTGHLDINVGWKKWASVTSFSRWDYGHLQQGSNGPDDYLKSFYTQRQNGLDVLITQDDPLLQVPTAYTQTNLMQKVRFKPNDTWDVQYGFHLSETSSYGRYDRHQRVTNGTPRYGEWKYGPQKWLMNNLSIRYTVTHPLFDQITLRTARQSFDESRISRDFNDIIRQRRTENVEAYSANLDLIKNTSPGNTIYYGVEYILNDVTSAGRNEFISDVGTEPDSTAIGPSRYPQSTWQSIAAYVNKEFRLSNQITLQGGIRYNHFILKSDFSNNTDFYPFPFEEADINNGALTGSIGLIYKPTESWIVRTNFGTAFRSPNVDDIGKVFDSEQGTVVVPNPDLEAEYAYSFDLGVTKGFSDRVKLDMSGYYTILDNAMVRRDFQIAGQDIILYDGVPSRVQALQNAAKATVYGVQASLEVSLSDQFNFSSDINYQSGEEELDNGSTSPSRHAAPIFGASRIRYQNSVLTVDLNTRYQGKRSHEDLAISEREKDEIYALDENGNTYSPAWYTLNLKSTVQLNNTFSVSAGLENITDQRYRPYSSGLSGPGRNFVVSLRAVF